MSTFGEVRKNTREIIKVSDNEYKGNRFVDVRVYYEDKDGEYKRSCKGITLNKHTIDEVIALLKKSAETLRT